MRRLRSEGAGVRRAWRAGASAVLAMVSASCAAPAAQELPGCVVLDGLREQSIGQVNNTLGGPYPAIGDSATYVHQLHDHGGNQVATIHGKTNVRLRMADGGLLEFFDERIEFGDGTVLAQGYYERGAGAQFLPLIGTAGVFRDKLGRRTFEPLDAAGSATTTFTLCPAGILK
ncbi:allene oxide cyclase barrel-like domain-containing protein [Amycolatopsis pithecellobii]|uniref:Allene oxide cyclase barrel-like domain-containing protein n=1 Tax=Amycolatopsis pithecellobii TaxID=664692 RepID=A0A6N7ZAT6_9PSEU|nr:hypothetical protein [Amycolatopsis pithecellobii]MTD58853.1 hypothetical protein [Amycolatopsis pithecellobii]